MIDARGRIRFKAKVIERGEQGKKVGGGGGEGRLYKKANTVNGSF